MKTLQDFKDEVTREMGHENYNQIFRTTSKYSIAECLEIACERHTEYMAVEFNEFIYNNCEEVDGGIKFKGKTYSPKELFEIFRQNKA